METTSDWVWEVDKTGAYTYASPKIKDLLGYEPAEALGKTPFDFMPPAERERVGRIFQDAMQLKIPLNSLENVNIHKNGRKVDLERVPSRLWIRMEACSVTAVLTGTSRSENGRRKPSERSKRD